jgi:hypothetical protein
MAPPTSKPTRSRGAPPTDPTGELSTSPEGSLSEAFRRDFEKARQALDRLRHRLHEWRRTTPPKVPGERVSSAELVTRLQYGLKREHDLVLSPLLLRLDAFGMRLINNETVPPEALEEGLGLVDRYLTELHDAQLQLLHLADVDPAQGPAALLSLQQLISDYDHARVRWATVRVMLRGYEEKIRGYSALLGLTLTQESRAERAWHEFEAQYIRTHVPTTFSPGVAEKWQTELDRVRDAGRADRVRIDDFLARTALYATV